MRVSGLHSTKILLPALLAMATLTLQGQQTTPQTAPTTPPARPPRWQI